MGIDLSRWVVPEEDIEFDVQDFAGQSLYSSTHQYFLVKRGIYMLVWRAHSMKGQISDEKFLSIMAPTKAMIASWLRQLMYQVPGVKILFVVTHIEGCNKSMLDRQCKYLQSCVQAEVMASAMITKHAVKQQVMSTRPPPTHLLLPAPTAIVACGGYEHPPPPRPVFAPRCVSPSHLGISRRVEHSHWRRMDCASSSSRLQNCSEELRCSHVP